MLKCPEAHDTSFTHHTTACAADIPEAIILHSQAASNMQDWPLTYLALWMKAIELGMDPPIEPGGSIPSSMACS